MKRMFLFGSVFLTFFLRRQIYEAIAAIFWQFASYVFTIRVWERAIRERCIGCAFFIRLEEEYGRCAFLKVFGDVRISNQKLKP